MLTPPTHISEIFRVQWPAGSTDIFWDDLCVHGYEESAAGARRFVADTFAGVPLELSAEIREQEHAPHADLLAHGEQLRAEILAKAAVC
jgi:hypothetical protein